MAAPDHPVFGSRIAIWLANEVPSRLVYGGVRYRVSDMPTRLEDDMSLLTHPLSISGWRFQGTDLNGRSRMFDVRRDGQDWRVIRVYD